MAKGTAGYSGTPLRKKLGLQVAQRVALIGEPAGFRDLIDASEELSIDSLDAGTDAVDALDGSYDFIQLFTDSRAALADSFVALAGHVGEGGMLWISWPKKSSPLAGDLTENEVRDIGLQTEFVDVKVCAIDQDWSGLKFLRRRGEPGKGQQ